MLSLTAAWSLAFLAPLYVFSLFPSPKQSILARQVPKTRPTVRIWAVLVVIFAVDFAWLRLLCSVAIPTYIYVCDAAVVIVPLLASLRGPRTVGELWGLAFGTGVIGISTFPSIVMR